MLKAMSCKQEFKRVYGNHWQRALCQAKGPNTDNYVLLE